jgi:hypothetical protein
MRQIRSFQADSDIQVTRNTVDIVVDCMVGNRVTGFRRTMNNQDCQCGGPSAMPVVSVLVLPHGISENLLSDRN